MTEQLTLWTGAFGDAYAARNAPTPALLEPRVQMWRRILSALGDGRAESVLEVGANIGLNLRALAGLTDAALWALEPNARARARLVADGVVPAPHVLAGTASDIPLGDGAVDLVFTSGVLIHVHPDDLSAACREIHRVARRYVAAIEYFNPDPVEVPYRGEVGQLFKRDFGAFWLDQAPTLSLVDYGFFWKRASGLDNLTWWLFHKS